MKRVLFIFGLLILISSCAHNNRQAIVTQKDAELDFVSSLTTTDTTTVLNMTEHFMSLVKNCEYSQAIDMITVLQHGIVYKPAESYISELINMFKFMQIESYELTDYFFTTDGNNDVCYRVISKDNDGDAMSFKIIFNPLKVDDNWYLALKDGNQSSKLLPKDKQVNDLAPAPKKIRLNSRSSIQ